MAFLGIALFAEGPTDHRFLSPLIRRVVSATVAEHAVRTLDLDQEVVPLTTPPGLRGRARHARIAAAAVEAAGYFHILCVHADGGGAPRRARGEQVEPGLAAALGALAPGSYGGVAIVPVREMEAWALVDGDALRTAFRTTLTDPQLGVPPRPRDVEALADPKQVLDAAYRATLRGSRRRAAAGAAWSLELIAEHVRMERLREVPSFAAFQGEMEAALRSLHFID